jgi:hypothetical protein
MVARSENEICMQIKPVKVLVLQSTKALQWVMVGQAAALASCQVFLPHE